MILLSIYSLPIDFIVGALIPIVTAFLSIFVKTRIDNKDNAEINEDINRIVNIIDKGDNDVLSLMIKNVAELREYYVINKQQARNSFSAALIMSILGFALFAAGVVASIFYPSTNTMQYATIGGAIVEIVAGLFFWLYSKAITQINLFHTSLLKTEKFLTAIQLVEKISAESRDETYSFIISKIISQDDVENSQIDIHANKKLNNKKKTDIYVEAALQ